MTTAKRITVIAFICLSGVSLDQFTKAIALRYLNKGIVSSYMHDTLRIGYTENHGAFLGLGDSLPQAYRYWIFVIAVGLFLAALLVYLIVKPLGNLTSVMGLSLVLAGGLSNLYDRATNNGAVVDFLNVGIGAIRTGVFNVADMAIMAGAMLIAISLFNQK